MPPGSVFNILRTSLSYRSATLDLTLLIWMASLSALAVAVATCVPRSFYMTDMLSHFVLQAAVGAIVLLPVAALAGMTFAVYPVLGLTLLLCGARLYPLYPVQRPAPSPAGRINILQVNLLRKNRKAEGLDALIAKESPDLITACEVNPHFASYLRGLDAYPHRHIQLCGNSGYGMAVLSKMPLRNVEEKYFVPGRNIPALFFGVDVGGREVRHIFLHTANPTYAFRARDTEMAAVAAWCEKERPERLVITGDLNATPFCTALRDLTRRAKVTGARAGRGFFGSFPVGTCIGLFRLPIDHVLVSDTLAVADFRLARVAGSDHLATVTTVTVR